MDTQKTFCILPFLHLYTQPDGEVKPCCIAGGFDNKQSLRSKSIEEIFNSEDYKQLRKDMLTGTRNKVCDVCYKKEDVGEFSPRHMYNQNLTMGGPCKWTMPKVNEDYSVTTEFQHLDIRFSNLCNFKCRMCNHSFSSNWYEDSKKIEVNGEKLYISHENTKVIQVSDTITSDILPYIKNLKSVYFAGGEPLINEQHYDLLVWLGENIESIDELDSHKKLVMHYNTNLSILKYRDYDFVKHWKKFKRVHLAVSCDGIGDIGEYQRTGFNHNTFIKNLTELRQDAISLSTTEPIDGISYSFQYTTTIFNIEHIFDFIDFMMENKFIDSEDCISFYYAWGPQYITLNNIPEKDKERITRMFMEKMETLSSEKTKDELINIINYMNTPATCDIKYVAELVQKLDQANNTDYRNITSIKFV
jgi:hypothetical protein